MERGAQREKGREKEACAALPAESIVTFHIFIISSKVRFYLTMHHFSCTEGDTEATL